jgi:hypothetical protein
MNNLKKVWNIKWLKVIIATIGTLILNIGLYWCIENILLDQLKEDIKHAKMGISRSEAQIQRLDKEINSLNNALLEKMENKEDDATHYYTLSVEPIRYINRYVLNAAKPDGILIKNSSVSSKGVQSLNRRTIDILKKGFGEQYYKSLEQYAIKLKVQGTFPSILQYIQNLYDLPINIMFYNFNLRQQQNGVELNVTLHLITYKLKV